MRWNTKPLNRNDGEHEGIRIAPLKLPRFSRTSNSFVVSSFHSCPQRKVAFEPNVAARMANRQKDTWIAWNRHLKASERKTICRQVPGDTFSVKWLFKLCRNEFDLCLI